MQPRRPALIERAVLCPLVSARNRPIGAPVLPQKCPFLALFGRLLVPTLRFKLNLQLTCLFCKNTLFSAYADDPFVQNICAGLVKILHRLADGVKGNVARGVAKRAHGHAQQRATAGRPYIPAPTPAPHQGGFENPPLQTTAPQGSMAVRPTFRSAAPGERCDWSGGKWQRH